MGWVNPRWASLTGPDAESLRAIFESLSKFLDAPTFERGITIGDGTDPTYDPVDDVVTPAPTTPVVPDSIVPDDDADPAQVTGLTVTAGVRSLLLRWNPNTEADVVDGFGEYLVQIDTASDFTAAPREQHEGGTMASFSDLTTSATYYARVAAVDAHGNQGAWSANGTGVPVQVATADLADLAVTNAKLGALAVTLAKLADDSVSTAKIVNAAVEEAKLATDSVTATKIAALSVVAGKIAANAVSTTELAALSVTAAKIAADTITANEIAANAIGTTELAALSVTAAKIAADTITAGQIAANAITTSELNADSVTAAKLAAISLEASKYVRSTSYVAGTSGWSIDADGSAEFSNVTVRGAVEATRFTAVAGSNLLPNPSFTTNITGWTITTMTGSRDAVVFNSTPASLKLTGGAGGFTVVSDQISVKPNTLYKLDRYVRGTSLVPVLMKVNWYTALGAGISTDTFTPFSVNNTSVWESFEETSLSTSSNSNFAQAPATAAIATIELSRASGSSDVWIDDIVFSAAPLVEGGVFRTASSGRRIEVQGGVRDTMFLWPTGSGETPGQFFAWEYVAGSGIRNMILWGPYATGKVSPWMRWADATTVGTLRIGDGNVIIEQNLDVDGTGNVDGTFNATGATTLGSTLGVTGAATLSSTLAVTGGVTANAHMDMPEIASPGNPAANVGRVYVRDTGGVTEYVARFSGGEIIVLACDADEDGTWTPTLAQGVSTNITKTVNEARYVRRGSIVEVWCSVTATGAGTAGSAITLSLPFTAAGHAAGAIFGAGFVFDASANVRYASVVEMSTTTKVAFSNDASAGGNVGAAPSFAVANTDIIRFQARFKV